MASPTDSFAVRLLGRLAHAVYHHSNWFLYPQILLFVGCVVYTALKLEFSTTRSDLVGADKKYHQNFLRFKKEFPGQDDLAVLVESEDREKNRQFVERLGARLEAEPSLFTDILYRNDLKMLGTNALLFADEESLNGLNKTLKEYRPFIEKFGQATNLVSLFDFVNRQFRTAPRPSKPSQEPQPSTRASPGPQQSTGIEAMIKALPALERIIRQAADNLARTGTPPSPGINALFGNAEEAEKQIYLTFAQGRLYLVSAHALTDALNFPALERLRVLVRETQDEVPGVNTAIIGEPVLEYDEMAQSKKDTALATVISLFLCALIFIYGYQETGRPVKATICLIIGLGYTMGFTTLVIGHLNILTITFAPMLIGMAIDFGVHLVTRYEEELRHGKTEREALEKAMVYTGQGIFTGCFTTAGAFLAMGITDFKGIQEMGIIAGGGMLICLVPMMTMLPVLLLRGKQNVLDHKWPAEEDRRARIERLWLERPVVVGWITAGLCVLALSQFRRVYFDYNLLHMQSPGLPSVEYTLKFLESGSNSVLFAAVISESVPQAIELETRLTNLTTVASVKSMAHFLSGEPPEKLMRIGEIKREVSSLHFAELDTQPVDVLELDRTLFSLKGYLGLALDEVRRRQSEKTLEDNLQCLRKAVEDFRQRLDYFDQRSASTKLAAFQQALFTDLRETFDTLKSQNNRRGMEAKDLPIALRNRFIGQTGKYLLQVYPKDNVWEHDHQEKFVKELRTVDPNVTGTPVQLYEYTTLLKDSYIEAAWYALAAIVILVLIHFRSLLCVAIALMPVAIGTIWMVGLMGWLDIPFNPANIMTLPLVIGIGVTNGIHILNRFAEEQNPGILAKSTGKAVLVSGLTTIAGFGSLMLAKHKGIESLGYVMSIGTATCMIAGLTFVPALVKFLTQRGWRLKKKPSGDNARSTLGREEPR
jgi:uncharacterized protein